MPADVENRPLKGRFKGAATRIFSGKVVKLDFLNATLTVERVWKGKPVEEIVMLTGTTKSADGYYVSSSCDYGYVLGEKYLILCLRAREQA